ncbi:tyrosine-type recombinase/integrase [Propionicimonas sp.]|uniref:tyrosine-type recombinase/integrase n=1 Tax=Propionicimonas sp. TaxID=1955623 RepID=UPI0039E55D98
MKAAAKDYEGCLRGVMDIAVTLCLVDANPCAKIKLRPAVRRDPRFLAVPEVRKLATATKMSSMVWLLSTTGLRVGECCALNVVDVDAGRGRLRVRKSKKRHGATSRSRRRC